MVVLTDIPAVKDKLIRLYKMNYNPPHVVNFYAKNGHRYYSNIVSQIVCNDRFYIVPKSAKKFSLTLNVFKSNDANSKLIPTFTITFYDSDRKKVYTMMSQRFRQTKRYRFMRDAFYYKIDICAFKIDKRKLINDECEFEFAGHSHMQSIIEEADSIMDDLLMETSESETSSDSDDADSLPTTASVECSAVGVAANAIDSDGSDNCTTNVNDNDCEHENANNNESDDIDCESDANENQSDSENIESDSNTANSNESDSECEHNSAAPEDTEPEHEYNVDEIELAAERIADETDCETNADEGESECDNNEIAENNADSGSDCEDIANDENRNAVDDHSSTQDDNSNASSADHNSRRHDENNNVVPANNINYFEADTESMTSDDEL